MYPYYLHNELNHRDFNQKDTDERYREALQKVRADRAEQQQKEIVRINILLSDQKKIFF
jgi:hypothetical protein